MIMSQTIVVRDVDFKILDIIEIDSAAEITHADIALLLRVHKAAYAIERVTTVERYQP
jgi:hypothetical protein